MTEIIGVPATWLFHFINKDWFSLFFSFIFQKIHIFKQRHISLNLHYANKLALHFSQTTNLASALEESQIPKSLKGAGLIPQLESKNVQKTLETFKICNSRVDGDIPRDLVKPCATKLAEALTPIYNASLLNKKWPQVWKTETIIPIPKTLTLGGFDDIRPISMTTLWSKILESYVAKFTVDETSKNWKNNQYGSRKGASADHVLVSLWDKILTGLDRGARPLF